MLADAVDRMPANTSQLQADDDIVVAAPPPRPVEAALDKAFTDEAKGLTPGVMRGLLQYWTGDPMYRTRGSGLKRGVPIRDVKPEQLAAEGREDAALLAEIRAHPRAGMPMQTGARWSTTSATARPARLGNEGVLVYDFGYCAARNQWFSSSGQFKKQTPAGRAGHAEAPAAAAAPRRSQEQDGGWTTEFQSLRVLPFDRAEYDRLYDFFFTEYEVCAGARESRTRGGTLRVTQRVTRKTVKIAEWSRLHATVEMMHTNGEFTAALAHLRCLEHYMTMVHHASIPRILRHDAISMTACAEESINLAESSDDEEEAAEVVDVDELEALLLGPVQDEMMVVEVKLERIDRPKAPLSAASQRAPNVGFVGLPENVLSLIAGQLTTGAVDLEETILAYEARRERMKVEPCGCGKTYTVRQYNEEGEQVEGEAREAPYTQWQHNICNTSCDKGTSLKELDQPDYEPDRHGAYIGTDLRADLNQRLADAFRLDSVCSSTRVPALCWVHMLREHSRLATAVEKDKYERNERSSSMRVPRRTLLLDQPERVLQLLGFSAKQLLARMNVDVTSQQRLDAFSAILMGEVCHTLLCAYHLTLA